MRVEGSAYGWIGSGAALDPAWDKNRKERGVAVHKKRREEDVTEGRYWAFRFIL